MEAIDYREFARHTGKYFKEGSFVISTRNALWSLNIVKIEKEVKEIKQELKISLTMSGEYGCGCKREDNQVLCSKHSRY